MFYNKWIHMFYLSPIGRSWNFIGYRNLKFVKLLTSITKDKKVLDVGAGDCQYKRYFSKSSYISQDICTKDKNYSYSKINIVSDIYKIPLLKESVDYILCTKVLEHLQYPEKAFKEFARILKKKGELWLTCPFVWEEHEIPYDFFRYTRYALKFLAETNGFKVVSIKPQGGKFIALGKIIKDLIPGLFENRRILNIVFLTLQFPLVFPILFFLKLIDPLDKSKTFTLQYECIFRKQ